MIKGLAGGEMASTVQRWKWSRPDVHTCTLLVQGLAASLRVSDALKMIGAVSRVGVSPGEEVWMSLFFYFFLRLPVGLSCPNYLHTAT